tara:strand:- start:724 stop:1167 length:444 start_codon:yes stop_codon:yes gene_type:complete
MIREATKDDIPRLLVMAETFIEVLYKDGAGSISYNPEVLYRLMSDLIEKPDGLLLVSDREGVNGMIGMFVYPHPMSGDMVGSELFWWMSPESRGGPDAFRLLRQAEGWLRELKVPSINVAAPTPQVARVYERLGYHPFEVHFSKAVS